MKTNKVTIFSPTVGIFYLLIPWCSSLAVKRYSRWRTRFSYADRTVVYNIDSVNSYVRALIHHYFGAIQTTTCVKFRQKTINDGTFVNFVDHYDGCSWRASTREVNLENEVCDHTVLHEIGHALGFFHEHSRGDRDLYVKVFMEHVPAQNKKALSIENLEAITPYDYLSVLHYEKRDPKGTHDWMETIDPNYQNNLPEIKRKIRQFSFYDLMGIHIVYRCDLDCPEPNLCRTHSFRGADCKCYCNAFAKTIADKNWLPHDSMSERINILNEVHTQKRTYECQSNEKAFIGSVCDPGWTRFSGQCYKYFPSLYGLVTFDVAGWQCARYNARIVSPTWKGENDFINELSGSIPHYEWIWLNLMYEESEGTWVFRDTGVPITREYQYHNIDDESIHSDSRHCLSMARDGAWYDVLCSQAVVMSVVCQKPYGCGFGWTSFNGSCYKLHSNTMVTWAEAKEKCVYYGAQLAFPTTEEENTFITQLLPSPSGYFAWIYAKYYEYVSRDQFGNFMDKVTSWNFREEYLNKFEKAWEFKTRFSPFWIGENGVQPWPNTPTEKYCVMLNRDGYWVNRNCEAKAHVICRAYRSARPGANSITVCDGHLATLGECRNAVIKVQRVFYGREVDHICPLPSGNQATSLNCIGVNKPDEYVMRFPEWNVRQMCEDRHKCSFRVGNDVLNGNVDPCPGTPKYLKVYYHCKEDRAMRSAYSNGSKRADELGFDFILVVFFAMSLHVLKGY